MRARFRSRVRQVFHEEFLETLNWSEGLSSGSACSPTGSLMNSSFLELLREEVGNYYTNMVEIEGGMDNLPRAFLPALQDHIRFGRGWWLCDQSPRG